MRKSDEDKKKVHEDTDFQAEILESVLRQEWCNIGSGIQNCLPWYAQHF